MHARCHVSSFTDEECARILYTSYHAQWGNWIRLVVKIGDSSNHRPALRYSYNCRSAVIAQPALAISNIIYALAINAQYRASSYNCTEVVLVYVRVTNHPSIICAGTTHCLLRLQCSHTADFVVAIMDQTLQSATMSRNLKNSKLENHKIAEEKEMMKSSLPTQFIDAANHVIDMLWSCTWTSGNHAAVCKFCFSLRGLATRDQTFFIFPKV